MSNPQTNQYIPDYLVLPGEVLEDYLEGYRMTQAELSARTGLAKKTINEIIKGKSPITPETALKLERALGRPAHFWNNLERQFQEDRIRLAEQQRLESYLDWLKKVPVNHMTKLGWITKHKDKVRQLEEVLCYFGIASPEQWKTVWQEYQVSFRQTLKFKTMEESVSAWLRQGEIQAREIACAPFNKKMFQGILKEIRDLTTEEDPRIFVPKMVEYCSSAGVVVVFVPELPNTGISGATRWLGDKAVIQLSLRYKSNDQLWFTFFHEAGHILKHGRRDIFLEGQGVGGEKEEEADTFSCDKLIPPVPLRQFIKKGNPTLMAIVHFAAEIGIAPGIVVGRLQHDGILPNNIGNKLKVFYHWSNDEAG